jgi:hypothetical protein
MMEQVRRNPYAPCVLVRMFGPSLSAKLGIAMSSSLAAAADLYRLRLFRYEVRCWRGGPIPDLGAAVGGARRLTDDPLVAHGIVDAVATVPTPVWGRDELRAGEMWNSNSVVAWLIATAGLATKQIGPPAGGRAPGGRLASRSRHEQHEDIAISSFLCVTSLGSRRSSSRRWGIRCGSACSSC